MRATILLGLTGGIGSGKSTVANLLAQRGAIVVDADAISRSLTGPHGAALPALACAFGTDFVGPDGALDRNKMRDLVYADASARQRLEAIVHPLVALETQAQSSRALARGCPCIVFDIPLLVESTRWRERTDHILVVDCTHKVQIERVLARNHLQREDVERIIASQATRTRRLGAADSVIFNANLSLDQLAAQVRAIAPRFGLSSP